MVTVKAEINVCNFIGRQEYMVIIKQDPGFFLNYVIVHCSFTCSVGATHRQELKQSANYKDERSPHLLHLNYFFPSRGVFPHNCDTFLLTYSLKAICIGWVEVDGELPRGCRAVSKAGAEGWPQLMAAPYTGRSREGRG